ncbi:unnamed protein product [Lactuca saligna]|uniref:Uncharacterized protein n=1 Tax=Lactuca saligna TaxID=75948 RepID=A0AA35YWB1_LACSI|nr:unnamed protein product [Lactuca saligna]
MFEGSKNDRSINPQCWVAMNFKQSIPYALLQTFSLEAYRDMASALSKADGIDYTDPEELLVATIMDLDAMDGKGSVSLLAKCSTSPNNTIKFFFNPKTTAKVHVLGSTYQNQLLKMIDVGGSSICLGDCPPDAILPHEECNKANKIAYYSELHNI